MLILDRLLQVFGLSKVSTQLNLELETQLADSLQNLAERERRPEKELAAEMLTHALAQRDAAEVRLETWHTLSPREQQIAASAIHCANSTCTAKWSCATRCATGISKRGEKAVFSPLLKNQTPTAGGVQQYSPQPLAPPTGYPLLSPNIPPAVGLYSCSESAKLWAWITYLPCNRANCT